MRLNFPSYADSPQKVVSRVILSTRQQMFFCISTMLIVSLLVVNIVLEMGECQCQQLAGGGDAANPPIDYPGDLKIKTRSSWLAAPPVSNIKSPVGIVIIAHTATPNCSNTSVCSKRVYSIQEYHQKSLHLDDVTYNFLIGGDGYAYEGRGFNSSGHCAKDLKASKICIAFIGSFSDVAPTDQQLDTAQRLLEVGVAEKKLSADYSLYGHRQFTTTESPGTRLFNIIKTWEHWREITSH